MAVVPKLTAHVVKAFRPPEDRPFVEVTCGQLRGFGVRVFRGGRRTAFVFYRGPNRRARRVSLGELAGKNTLARARERAETMLLAVRRGEDPAAERDAARKVPTLGQLLDQYETDRIPELAESNQAAEKNLVKHVRKRWGRRNANAIDSADLERFRSAMKKAGKPGAFNKQLGLLSRVYNWAIRLKLYPGQNPTKGVRKNREKKVERFLSPEERGRLAAVLKEAEIARKRGKVKGSVDPGAIAAIRLLCMTGMRRGEVLDLRWSDVDLQRRIIRLEESKTGQKAIPITPQAAAYIGTLPRLFDRVCPGEAGGRVTNLNRIWGELRTKADLEDVRLHDLRHSFASDMVMSGAPLAAVGKALGHKTPAMTARYAHLADEYMAGLMERAGAAIEEKTEAGAKVISIAKGRGK